MIVSIDNIKRGISVSLFFFPIMCSLCQTEITTNGSFHIKPDISNYYFEAYPLDRVEGWSMINTCDYFYSKNGDYSYAFGVMRLEYPVCKLKAPLKEGCTYKLKIEYSWASFIYNRLNIGAAFLTRNEWSQLSEERVEELAADVTFKINKKGKKNWKDVTLHYTATGNEEYILLGLAGSITYDFNSRIRYKSVSLTAVDDACNPVDEMPEIMTKDEVTGNPIRLPLYYTFYYNSASYVPNKGIDKLMLDINDFLPTDTIIIEINSYCDTIGSKHANEKLAQMRADYIKDQIESRAFALNKEYIISIIGESQATSDMERDRKTVVTVYRKEE